MRERGVGDLELDPESEVGSSEKRVRLRGEEGVWEGSVFSWKLRLLRFRGRLS